MDTASPSSLPRKRDGESVTFALLAIFIVLVAAWPAFRAVFRSTLEIVSRPLASALISSSPRTSSSETRLAELARSMEFRVQEFQITPTSLQAWRSEWKCNPLEDVMLLRFLLRQLPEIGTREMAPNARQNLLQAITELSAQIKTVQPENGFPWLADALTAFYQSQDAPALLALKQAVHSPRMQLGLKELNHSEHALWQLEQQRAVLPPAPRNWNMELERPLHSFSRSLVVQEKALLQKYNMERAEEVTLLHLTLAAQLADEACTPFDFAITKAMATRALEPYWNAGAPYPDLKTLAQNLSGFLDDQGDRLSATKVKGWGENWNSRDISLRQNMKRWRWTQQLAIWNVSSVAASLLLQAASMCLAWMTFLIFVRRTATVGRATFHLRDLIFALPPLFWSVTQWPPGGSYLGVGLLLAWTAWLYVVMSRHPRPAILELRGELSRSLTFLLTSLILFLSAAAGARFFRGQVFHQLNESGWFS